MTRVAGFPSVMVLLAVAAAPVGADSFPVVLQGKVVTEDGEAPPVTVSVERVCSDEAGSTNGVLTNKKGEYIWRLDVDPQKTRACFLRASHAGYVSTSIDISALNGVNGVVNLPPLVLTSPSSNPYSILSSDSSVPGKAKKAWDKAMKDLTAHDREGALAQMQEAVAAAPKFAIGWHGLGVTYEALQKQSEARDAYTHAIEADPKFLPPYMTLVRLCVKTKDWHCVSQSADALIKADSKHSFQEVYLHRAAARFELKDLDGAESDAQEAIRLDTRHKLPRVEYVLGRVLLAKGNAGGAREHIAKFLELNPTAADASLVKAYLENPAQAAAPDLDPL